MIEELSGTITYVNGETEPFVAKLLDEVDESGCRVYEARIPRREEIDDSWWFASAKVDVIPAKSALHFTLVDD